MNKTFSRQSQWVENLEGKTKVMASSNKTNKKEVTGSDKEKEDSEWWSDYQASTKLKRKTWGMPDSFNDDHENFDDLLSDLNSIVENADQSRTSQSCQSSPAMSDGSIKCSTSGYDTLNSVCTTSYIEDITLSCKDTLSGDLSRSPTPIIEDNFIKDTFDTTSTKDLINMVSSDNKPNQHNASETTREKSSNDKNMLEETFQNNGKCDIKQINLNPVINIRLGELEDKLLNKESHKKETETPNHNKSSTVLVYFDESSDFHEVMANNVIVNKKVKGKSYQAQNTTNDKQYKECGEKEPHLQLNESREVKELYFSKSDKINRLDNTIKKNVTNYCESKNFETFKCKGLNEENGPNIKMIMAGNLKSNHEATPNFFNGFENELSLKENYRSLNNSNNNKLSSKFKDAGQIPHKIGCKKKGVKLKRISWPSMITHRVAKKDIIPFTKDNPSSVTHHILPPLFKDGVCSMTSHTVGHSDNTHQTMSHISLLSHIDERLEGQDNYNHERHSEKNPMTSHKLYQVTADCCSISMLTHQITLYHSSYNSNHFQSSSVNCIPYEGHILSLLPHMVTKHQNKPFECTMITHTAMETDNTPNFQTLLSHQLPKLNISLPEKTMINHMVNRVSPQYQMDQNLTMASHTLQSKNVSSLFTSLKSHQPEWICMKRGQISSISHNFQELKSQKYDRPELIHNYYTLWIPIYKTFHDCVGTVKKKPYLQSMLIHWIPEFYSPLNIHPISCQLSVQYFPSNNFTLVSHQIDVPVTPNHSYAFPSHSHKIEDNNISSSLDKISMHYSGGKTIESYSNNLEDGKKSQTESKREEIFEKHARNFVDTITNSGLSSSVNSRERESHISSKDNINISGQIQYKLKTEDVINKNESKNKQNKEKQIEEKDQNICESFTTPSSFTPDDCIAYRSQTNIIEDACGLNMARKADPPLNVSNMINDLGTILFGENKIEPSSFIKTESNTKHLVLSTSFAGIDCKQKETKPLSRIRRTSEDILTKSTSPPIKKKSRRYSTESGNHYEEDTKECVTKSLCQGNKKSILEEEPFCGKVNNSLNKNELSKNEDNFNEEIFLPIRESIFNLVDDKYSVENEFCSDKSNFTSQTIEENTKEMYFRYNGIKDSVKVCGSFNNWLPMDLDNHGNFWSKTVRLKPGVHNFKYVVDGIWLHDPNFPTTHDEGGSVINVININESNIQTQDNIDSMPVPVNAKIEIFFTNSQDINIQQDTNLVSDSRILDDMKENADKSKCIAAQDEKSQGPTRDEKKSDDFPQNMPNENVTNLPLISIVSDKTIFETIPQEGIVSTILQNMSITNGKGKYESLLQTYDEAQVESISTENVSECLHDQENMGNINSLNKVGLANTDDLLINTVNENIKRICMHEDYKSSLQCKSRIQTILHIIVNSSNTDNLSMKIADNSLEQFLKPLSDTDIGVLCGLNSAVPEKPVKIKMEPTNIFEPQAVYFQEVKTKPISSQNVQTEIIATKDLLLPLTNIKEKIASHGAEHSKSENGIIDSLTKTFEGNNTTGLSNKLAEVNNISNVNVKVEHPRRSCSVQNRKFPREKESLKGESANNNHIQPSASIVDRFLNKDIENNCDPSNDLGEGDHNFDNNSNLKAVEKEDLIAFQQTQTNNKTSHGQIMVEESNEQDLEDRISLVKIINNNIDRFCRNENYNNNETLQRKFRSVFNIITESSSAGDIYEKICLQGLQHFVEYDHNEENNDFLENQYSHELNMSENNSKDFENKIETKFSETKKNSDANEIEIPHCSFSRNKQSRKVKKFVRVNTIQLDDENYHNLFIDNHIPHTSSTSSRREKNSEEYDIPALICVNSEIKDDPQDMKHKQTNMVHNANDNNIDRIKKVSNSETNNTPEFIENTKTDTIPIDILKRKQQIFAFQQEFDEASQKRKCRKKKDNPEKVDSIVSRLLKQMPSNSTSTENYYKTILNTEETNITFSPRVQQITEIERTFSECSDSLPDLCPIYDYPGSDKKTNFRRDTSIELLEGEGIKQNTGGLESQLCCSIKENNIDDETEDDQNQFFLTDLGDTSESESFEDATEYLDDESNSTAYKSNYMTCFESKLKLLIDKSFSNMSCCDISDHHKKDETNEKIVKSLVRNILSILDKLSTSKITISDAPQIKKSSNDNQEIVKEVNSTQINSVDSSLMTSFNSNVDVEDMENIYDVFDLSMKRLEFLENSFKSILSPPDLLADSDTSLKQITHEASSLTSVIENEDKLDIIRKILESKMNSEDKLDEIDKIVNRKENKITDDIYG